MWPLELCSLCQVLEAIFTSCIDVCLETKEGRFGSEATAGCLPSGGSQGECVRMVESVLVGGLLWLGVNSLVVFVRRSLGDGLTGKAESDV